MVFFCNRRFSLQYIGVITTIVLVGCNRVPYCHHFCSVAIKILVVAIGTLYRNEYMLVVIVVTLLPRYFIVVAIVVHIATIITRCDKYYRALQKSLRYSNEPGVVTKDILVITTKIVWLQKESWLLQRK